VDKQKINVKKVLEYKDAVSYIEDLAKSFRSGTIVLESGGEHVAMKPSAQVSIKVEAKTKKDKQKIAFELSWTEAASADLKIDETQPETVPVAQPEGGAPAVQPKANAPATQEPAKTPAKAEKAQPPAKNVSEVPAKTETKTAASKTETKTAASKTATKKSAGTKTATKKTAPQKTAKKAPAKPAGNK